MDGGTNREQTLLPNLLSHPFARLGARPSDTAAQVEMAFDAALALDPQAASDLISARDTIHDADRRLTAELNWLLDSSPAQIRHVVVMLRDAADPGDLKSVAQGLPPLSRAHVLAHGAVQEPADAALLCALVDAQASIDATTLYGILKICRDRAGAAAPSLAKVATGLQTLVRQQAHAAIARYPTVAHAADPLLAALLDIGAGLNVYRLEASADLVTAYQRRAEPQITARERLLEQSATAVRHRADAAFAGGAVAHALCEWGALCGPLIAWEACQGRTDPRVSRLAIAIRGLLTDLTAGRRHGDASMIAHAAFETFSALPSPTSMLRLDIKVMGSAALDADTRPLRDMADALLAHSALEALARDLTSGGFGEASINSAKKLWDLFRAAAEATRTTASEAMPWKLMIDLANRINDELDLPAPALAILSGLRRHGEMIAPDSTLVGAARELEDALRLKLRRKEIDADIQARTQRKNFIRKRLRWAAGAAVLAGLLVYLSPTKLFVPPTTSSNIETPPPAEAAKVTAQEAANEEAIPPVGTGQDFSRQNLRYCHFQKERLLIIKQGVQRVEDIDAFNAMARDYSSRCTDFLYLEDDIRVVRAEAVSKRNEIEADARRIMSGWPWRNNATAGVQK